MKKLIIFDLSGVVSSNEEIAYLRMFCRKHRISFNDFEKVYFDGVKKSERGEIPLKYAWENALQKFRIEGDYKHYIREMMGMKRFNKKVLDFILKLRKKYKIAYFTNYAEEYWKIHEKLIDLGKYFDFGIVSYKIGSRKPEIKGFRIILNKFNVVPKEAVFLDDSKKNLKNAKDIGINTIHFKDLEQLKRELKRLGVEA